MRQVRKLTGWHLASQARRASAKSSVWRTSRVLTRGLVTVAVLGSTALGVNVLATSPSGAAGPISPWLAMDGSIRFISNGTNSFGWANEGPAAGTTCPAGAVDVAGTHGLFNCGSPNADPTVQANPATPTPAALADPSILGQTFLTDPFGRQTSPGCSKDTTTFHSGQKFGGSNAYNIPKTGTPDPNSKTDLTNAYFVSRVQQAGEPTPGDKELYFGVERLGNNGDVAANIEFLQAGASITGTCAGTLNMPRSQGDFAIEFNFVNGGTVPAPVLDIWQCTGNNTSTPPPLGTSCDPGGATFPNAGYVAQTTIPAGVIELAENSGDIPCGGWVCGSGTTVNADEFVEGGIDLSAIGLATACSGSFIADSQESQSNKSNMTDFVGPAPVTLCSPSTTTTTPVLPNSQTIGNSWSDSATVQGNATFGSPAGTVQFYSCSPTQLSNAGASTCSNTIGTALGTPVGLTAGSGNASTATSPPITPNELGTWCFAGYYSGDPGKYLASADASSGECFTVNPVTPSFTTTVAAPTDPVVGSSWNDSALLTGVAALGAPAGSVAFTFCKETTVGTPCTGGNAVDTLTTATSTTADSSTWTLPPADAQTPMSVGTYCFNAAYTAAVGSDYASVAQQTDAECFAVMPAPSSTNTQQSTTTTGLGSIVLSPTGSVTDTATVTGNATGGVPTGTVTFFVCGATSGAALCTTGHQVGSAVTLSGTGDTARATSAPPFLPTATGTYCFAAVYSPDAASNYAGSSDNMSGTVDVNECFTVTPAASTPANLTSTPTPTPAASPGAAPAALAFTGADIGGMVAGGLALLGVGGFMVFASRRRRHAAHAR